MMPRQLRRVTFFIAVSCILILLAYLRITITRNMTAQYQVDRVGTTSTIPKAAPAHLIIVACHAIYLGQTPVVMRQDLSAPTTDIKNQYADLPSHNESNWLIEPFQAGETATYVRHIEAGVRRLAEAVAIERSSVPRADAAAGPAILVFSGAATKRAKTSKSEGHSYLVSRSCVCNFPGGLPPGTREGHESSVRVRVNLSRIMKRMDTG